nr:arylamine N-acetyltransferase [Nocardiopsis alba]
MDLRTEQKDPHGTFVVADAPYGDLDLIRDGRLLYRIETRPREVEDFLPVLWWFQTSPDSPFRRHLFCSLATERGRITLSGDTLITSENGRQDKVRLVGDDEIRDAYRVHFGIEIDRLPPLPSPVAGAPEIP